MKSFNIIWLGFMGLLFNNLIFSPKEILVDVSYYFYKFPFLTKFFFFNDLPTWK